MQNNHCNKCGKLIAKEKNIWKCVNLGCTEYNKQVRRNRANRKKRQKKEILIQEEE